MEFQPAHESETEIKMKEQLQTETEMAAEVVQEKSSATTSTELQFNILIPSRIIHNKWLHSVRTVRYTFLKPRWSTL